MKSEKKNSGFILFSWIAWEIGIDKRVGDTRFFAYYNDYTQRQRRNEVKDEKDYYKRNVAGIQGFFETGGEE